MRIVALDRCGLALGLLPGMMLADARARVPDLVAVDHDPAADRRLIERIADLCDRYTPMVALDPPDGVTLDITGCAHLFGGEAAMAARGRGAAGGGWACMSATRWPPRPKARRRSPATRPRLPPARRRRSGGCRSRRCGWRRRRRRRCAAPASRPSAISPPARPRRSPHASATAPSSRSTGCSAAPTAASPRCARRRPCSSNAVSPSRSRRRPWR